MRGKAKIMLYLPLVLPCLASGPPHLFTPVHRRHLVLDLWEMHQLDVNRQGLWLRGEGQKEHK